MSQYWVLNKTNLDSTVGGLKTAIPDNMASTELPKLKFNFTIQIYPRAGSYPTLGNTNPEFMDFQLKTATRPNINVNLVDVNFYNFRSKVATKIDYGTITVSFYDDPLNRAHSLFTDYFGILSPVFSRTREQANNLDRQGPGGAASVGPLPNSARNGLLSAIAVGQQYQVAGQFRETIYNYLNPKIQSVDLGELDMSVSDANLVSITYSYDSVNIIER
jgi:hypothetical protein